MHAVQDTAAILEAWDAQGVHRTGSDVDRHSARWLAELAREAGAEAACVAFSHDHREPKVATLESDGRAARGVPAFDAPDTEAGGLRGTLGPLGGPTALAVETVTPGWELPPGPALLESRRRGAHRGLILVAAGPKIGFPPGFALLNADAYAQPFGPPVLQLPSTDAEWILDAAARGDAAELRVESERSRVEAHNVELRIPGANPGLAPLVIMTPRSAWWECTSERGGGLVAWLACVRALARAGSQRDVVAIATTGHELGHLGLDDFLARNPELVATAHAWLHLGANLGAAVRGSLRLQTSDAALEAVAGAALADAGVTPDATVSEGQRPAGEARNVFDGGGRYVSLLGGNGLFHTPADRWPDCVDLQRVDALARVAEQVALTLSRD